ncbi:hypothetical protein MJT46_018732 [Ovis ammon polii x Ovis aries]|nr:hypothetical protein MJT46_018732 [Ovis ammon polii x Ovis aries]
MCDEHKFCQNGNCKLLHEYDQYQHCDSLVKCKGHGNIMLAIIALDGAVYFLSNPICLVLTFGGAKQLEYAGSTNTVHNLLSKYLGRRECRNLYQKSAVVTAVSLTDFETARLQITVPRKIETNTKDGSISETHVSYSIQIDKKTYTFPLEKQSFLDSNLLVYSYNKSGVLYPDSSFIKGHCFYQGYAIEIPNSAATLSICSGLRGLLQFENVSYGIEPLESSTTYEHVIYPFRDKKSDFSPISENSSTTQFADQSYKILVKSNKDLVVPLKRVLKIRVIIDKALYDYMGSEVTLASEKIIYVFSLINTMYSQLQVSVILTSLEIWSYLNKISTDGDAHEVLQRFVSWREKNLLQSSHDLTYLLIRSHGIKFFSSCSIDEFKHTTSQPKLECLQNQTVPKVFPQGRQSICGNGVLEPPEQCDCGTMETCEYSKCCDPLNCVLKGKAECGSGPCCGKNTCKILDRGRECRKSTDPCDFPEFCNGVSEFCAPDMRAADLQTCNNKSSYCFGGICQDRTTQCINLFGKSKTAALIKRRRASQKNNLMISFYVSLPFFILMAIVALKWNKMKIFWNKEGTLNGESPSENSNSNSSQSHRGLLQFENVSYGIEPLEPSIGFEHMVYQVKPRDSSSSVYTEKEIEPREKPYKIQNVEPLPDFSQYIEMHIVVEKDLYNHMGADTTIVIQKIFQLTGLTNAIFTSFNITVILSSLELWIDENKIPVTGDANELLHRFLKWKRSYLVLRPHDVAFLLVNVKCGKIQCTYSKTRIIYVENASVLYSNINGQRCVGLDYAYGTEGSEMMWVKDGTVCGERKVCNNKKNCHCNPSYLPPNCQHPLPSWEGGSIDSGNFPPSSTGGAATLSGPAVLTSPGSRHANGSKSSTMVPSVYKNLVPNPVPPPSKASTWKANRMKHKSGPLSYSRESAFSSPISISKPVALAGGVVLSSPKKSPASTTPPIEISSSHQTKLTCRTTDRKSKLWEIQRMTGMETSQRAEPVTSQKVWRMTAHLNQRKMERKAVIRMALFSL